MGEVISFPSRSPSRAAAGIAFRRRPPETVFQNNGWRILELPSSGQYVAISAYCRRGILVGRFAPQAAAENHHEGTEIAILTYCGTDEKLARCTIAWLNSDGPRTAILGPFVVAVAGRYRYWRDAIVEVAAIGGTRLARLVDGSIAIAREPEPVPLLDLFAPVKDNRRRAAFDRLPRETRAAILRWADPSAQFGDWYDILPRR
ncbi:MAG: hypothetical protein JO096_10440 [Alphaproteobacteria bacterium]|nr:hypothetical protein [Alphaproteobacteria bacterium]MBV9687618.1 hypothetical protein [Alphaproteobacteria bacterium]